MPESIAINDANSAPQLIAIDQVEVNGESVNVQRVKPGFGAEGEYQDISEATPLPVIMRELLWTLRQLVNPIERNVLNATQRVSIDGANAITIQANQTVGAVTTVGTVTNQAQIGGTRADTLIMDTMTETWANAVRGRIS